MSLKRVFTKPPEDGPRYFNRHHSHAVILQAAADETLLFRDFYAGEPGSLHDSRVFRRSPLCKKILENPDELFDDEQHILGDGAYILTDRVMTPFRDGGNLTPEQLNFNHRHASARVVVEKAFGLLKGKWRRLKFLTSYNLIYAIRTIAACVVLHNFILLSGEVPLNNDGQHNPQEQLHLHMDDVENPHIDHPNVVLERDHPLLAPARVLGVEKRLDIMGRLPEVCVH